MFDKINLKNAKECNFLDLEEILPDPGAIPAIWDLHHLLKFTLKNQESLLKFMMAVEENETTQFIQQEVINPLKNNISTSSQLNNSVLRELIEDSINLITQLIQEMEKIWDSILQGRLPEHLIHEEIEKTIGPLLEEEGKKTENAVRTALKLVQGYGIKADFRDHWLYLKPGKSKVCKLFISGDDAVLTSYFTENQTQAKSTQKKFFLVMSIGAILLLGYILVPWL